MTRYFSEEYFKGVEAKSVADSAWMQATNGMKSTVRLTATVQGSSYFVKIGDDATSIAKAESGTEAEFAFGGNYEVWTKVAKGEVDLQAAVLKGMLRFKGSITKILAYKDRFARLADVMKDAPTEY